MLSAEHQGLPEWLSVTGCCLILLVLILGLTASQTIPRRSRRKMFQYTAWTGVLMCACFITSVLLDYTEINSHALPEQWYISKFCVFTVIGILFLVYIIKNMFRKKRSF